MSISSGPGSCRCSESKFTLKDMRLLEAIIDANHRALDGDSRAGLHLGEHADSLPLIALTCIDPRLNKLFPGALALPDDNFIWLRNAGNIIFGPMSTMMRSLALACAVKGGKEIAIIGHSDCQVRLITQPNLLKRFEELGIPRQQLPEDIIEFFGTFNNERDNVVKSVNFVRQSPLIGPRVPVHGMIIDTPTGRLEWVVNGYEAVARAAGPAPLALPELGSPSDSTKLGSFSMGALKFPDQKIGEIVTQIRQEADATAENVKKKVEERLPSLPNAGPAPALPPDAPPPPPIPKSVPVPPPISTKYRHTGSWRIKP